MCPCVGEPEAEGGTECPPRWRTVSPKAESDAVASKAGSGANKGTLSCCDVGALAGVDPCARRFWERGKSHRDAEICRALNRCMWGRGQPWSNSRDSPFSPIADIGASRWAAARYEGSARRCGNPEAQPAQQ